MTEEMILLKELETAVSKHQDVMLHQTLDMVLKTGINVKEIRSSIVQGLDQVRSRLLSNETSLPDFILCLDTANEGLHRLTSLKKGELSAENTPRIVIGAVEGDPHDLGKNIISGIYKTCGYQVVDLGAQVPKEIFIEHVKEKGEKILALSAMMSTTMSTIPEIIKRVRAISDDTMVMVGGAPIDKTLAISYGADGYAESAVTVIEETEAALKRFKEGNKWTS